jgi:hypothetical protein
MQLVDLLVQRTLLLLERRVLFLVRSHKLGQLPLVLSRRWAQLRTQRGVLLLSLVHRHPSSFEALGRRVLRLAQLKHAPHLRLQDSPRNWQRHVRYLLWKRRRVACVRRPLIARSTSAQPSKRLT